MSGSNIHGSYASMPKTKDNDEDSFEACAATPSLFLYTEGTTVICLRHESLTLERKFEQHTHDVKFICVDNVSERGAGRLVVTYDVGRTAIVWDLLTGEQISRFASYEPLTVAAWMRNGNLAFGNEKGEVILFEPATNVHVSARTIFDPITAIAPAADCKTYAIGYRNGSILLAALQPQFTILHTLSTIRAPSPIAGLTWHASSSKQKSDMLATHTVDGDLRVWSVAKPPLTTAPRVIRNLKQPESYMSRRNWISWSKNGRILQHAVGAVWAWDVRTKDVSCEVIPTVEHVRGIAAFGPAGIFFTLGPDFTIQQYDVDSMNMVQNVRRPPIIVPQTPPQEFIQPMLTSESETDIVTPERHARTTPDPSTAERKRTTTPPSGHSREDSAQSSKPSQVFSPNSRMDKSTTTISASPQTMLTRDVYSPASNRSGRKASRLRQEVIMSPEERPIPDLFPYTRERLSDVPYRQTKSVDEAHMTPDDLRRQMLSVVFGWDDDIRSLLNEELSRLPAESAHAVFLTRWLDKEADEVAAAISASNSNPTLNWMRLALSSVRDSPASKKVAQVLIEQMLLQGDVHAAVTALIACGDWNDAIEVYVSRNLFMEAVLLTCLLMPTEWQRLSFLVRKWAEKAVSKAEQHLAVRCYSCTGVEPSEPWTSPGAQLATSSGQQAPLLQPSIYHKTMERRSAVEGSTYLSSMQPPVPVPEPTQAVRSQPPASGLKLITSFGGKDHYKFPGLMSDEGTPINAALVTPIAESAAPRSAISPGGFGSYRSNNMRSLNSAMANRPLTPGGAHKHRLPSIGETTDQEVPQLPSKLISRAPPTPADSGSDKEREKFAQPMLVDPVQAREELPMLLTPARYEPPAGQTRQTPQTAFAKKQEFVFSDRLLDNAKGQRLEGLSLQTFSTNDDQSGEEQLVPHAYGDVIDRPSTTDTINSMEFPDSSNPPDTGNSYSSYNRSLRSPSAGARSLDQYISSLEQAQFYKPRARGNSTASKQSNHDTGDRKKYKARDMDGEDPRSRNEMRNSHGPKKSPSSPIPMSPAELGLYTGSMDSLDVAYLSSLSANPAQQAYFQLESRSSTTTPGERRKQRSRSRQPKDGKTRHNSRAASRRRSPDGSGRNGRGRSESRRDESHRRSASSPEVMQPSEDDGSISSVDPALRFVSQNRNRIQSQSGRQQERSSSKPRATSPEPKSSRIRSRSRQPESTDTSLRRKSSVSNRGEKGRKRSESSVDVQREERALGLMERRPESSRPDFERPTQNRSTYIATNRRTKELAQAELEARRLSLQRRPSAPAVPLPGQDFFQSRSDSFDHPPPPMRAHTDTLPVTLATLSAHPSFPETNPFARSRITTPRAMKHPTHGQHASVPELPKMDQLLTNDVYQQPKQLNHSSISIRQMHEAYTNPEVPADMPIHPAFDANLGLSRPSSRHVSSNRAASRERLRSLANDVQVLTIGEENYGYDAQMSGPPVVPELQHLAMPPPPPPPPMPPHHSDTNGSLRIQTTDLNAIPTNIPLPHSAHPSDRDYASTISPPVSNEPRHRRGRSGSDQFMGKIKNLTGRMRSSSRGRSNSRPRDAKSPPVGVNEHQYSPYESLPNPNMHQQQMSSRELATVMEGR